MSEECRQTEDIVAGLSTPVWQRSIIDNGCDGSMDNGSMVYIAIITTEDYQDRC